MHKKAPNQIAPGFICGQTFPGHNAPKDVSRHKAKPEDYLGKRLGGHYEIKSVLGQGGLGRVYLGQDTRNGRGMAIKMYHRLPREKDPDPDCLVAEAKIIAGIDHPNIVKVFDSGFIDHGPSLGMPYVAMERLEGEDLARRLRLMGSLSWAETKGIVSQVCLGLQALHTNDIVHGDIKPSNVFIENGGRAKIIDFDLSRFDILDVVYSAAEEKGAIFGTPNYISPEQARGDLGVDARADIYALGVMMYQMLSGRLPFMGDNTASLLHAHQNIPPPPLGSGNLYVPEDIEAFVMRTLEKRREKRYRDTKEMHAVLLSVNSSMQKMRNIPIMQKAVQVLSESIVNRSTGRLPDPLADSVLINSLSELDVVSMHSLSGQMQA